jgi:hypothetical protein
MYDRLESNACTMAEVQTLALTPEDYLALVTEGMPS